MKAIAIGAIGAALVMTLTAQSWFSAPDENDVKTWKDAKALLSRVCAAANTSSNTDCQITIWRDGSLWMTVKTPNGSEMRGRGSSPWGAAEDLTKGAGDMRDAIQRAIHGGS